MSPYRSAAPLLLALLLAQPLAPAVITVEGACNLPAAIAAANGDTPVGGCPAGSGADVIRLTDNVLLTVVDNITDGPNGLPSVTTEITVEGGGFGVLREFVSAPDFRIFHVSESGELNLEDLSVLFGRVEAGDDGGGIRNAGLLTLRNTSVSVNAVRSRPAYSSYGGGIFNEGTAALYESRIAQNSVVAEGERGSGGGVFAARYSELSIEGSSIDDNAISAARAYGGGVFGSRDVSLTIRDSTISGGSAVGTVRGAGGGAAFTKEFALSNTTVSGNSVVGGSLYSLGGGIYAGFASGTVDHVTFSGNSADFGSALYAGSGITVSGSLFAASAGNHCSGPFVDGGGGNLADDDSCRSTIAGTLSGLVSTLADNGGPTETHALQSGSTAIDISGACGLAVDQRSAARPTPCDSGAFEYLGCDLLEIEDRAIDSTVEDETCHSAVLGPDLVVEGSGSLQVTAAYLVTIRDDVVVENGGTLSVLIDP